MIDELKTDYKDDVLATSQQGKRTFNIVGKNGKILFEDVHIEDTSKYTQVGDEYGQSIINEQNSAINQLSKGTGYVFDTYAEYLEAYQGGEIPVNAIVYIKEGSVDGTITALQVKYNDSNVKLALDTLGTRIDGKQDKLTNPLTKSDVVNNLNTTTTNVPLSANMGKALQDRLSTYKLLGSANTPTTARTAVTINFNENVNNFAFVFIKYGFGWGASHVVTIPTRVGLGVPFLPEIGHGGVPEQNNIRIEMSGASCKITTGDYDYGTTASGAPNDTIQVYGVIRING